jgi:hypothetical protein
LDYHKWHVKTQSSSILTPNISFYFWYAHRLFSSWHHDLRAEGKKIQRFAVTKGAPNKTALKGLAFSLVHRQ